MLKDRIRALAKIAALGLAILLIVRALATDGANSAASAASLGGALSAVAVFALLVADWDDMRRFWRRNRLAVLGFAALILYVIITLVPLPLPLDNPLYRQLGLPSGARSIAPYRGLEGLAALSAPAAAFLIGALLSPTRKDRDRTALLMLLGAAVFILAAFGRYIASLSEGEARLAAGVGANGACTAMFMLALVGAGDVLRRLGQKPSSRRRAAISMPKALRALEVSPLGVAVATLAITGALLTQSRAGLASGALGFLVLFLCARPPRQTGKAIASTIAVVGVIVVVAALLLLAEFAIGRFSGAVGEDFSMRWALVQESWRAFLAEPLTGHGLNSFHEINAHYANPATWSATRFVGAAHNIFTEWLEETGLIGAALMALVLAGPLSHTVKASRDTSSARAWAAVAIAVCVVCGLHGLFDFGLEIPAIAALFGLILGAFAQPLAAPTGRATPATARAGQSPAIAASNTASLDAVVIR